MNVLSMVQRAAPYAALPVKDFELFALNILKTLWMQGWILWPVALSYNTAHVLFVCKCW